MIAPTASPAGDVRERSVCCGWCGTPTFNFEATCDGCLGRRPLPSQLTSCRSCGRPITKPHRWCSTECHRADEGVDTELLDARRG